MGKGAALIKVGKTAGKAISWVGAKGSTSALRNVAAGYIGWNVLVKGDGLVDTGKYVLFGSEKSKQSILGAVTDEVVGEGASKAVVDGARNTIDKVEETAKAVKNELTGIGLPSSQSLDYPVNPQYSVNGDYQTNPNMYPQVQYSQTSDGGPLSSINDMVNRMSNGRMNTSNLLELMTAAYLMFGRFGWLGKLGSMIVGSSAVRDMQNRRSYNQMAQYQMSVQNSQPVDNSMQPVPSVLQTPNIDISEKENNNVVTRLRI